MYSFKFYIYVGVMCVCMDMCVCVYVCARMCVCVCFCVGGNPIILRKTTCYSVKCYTYVFTNQFTCVITLIQ